VLLHRSAQFQLSVVVAVIVEVQTRQVLQVVHRVVWLGLEQLVVQQQIKVLRVAQLSMVRVVAVQAQLVVMPQVVALLAQMVAQVFQRASRVHRLRMVVAVQVVQITPPVQAARVAVAMVATLIML
jgi:hypothetical protein